MKGVSPLAHLIDRPKDLEDRSRDPYGVCLHTTGSTIVQKALKAGLDPLEAAVAYYARPDTYSAHYVVGYDGTIIQVSDEMEKCQHIGLSPAERQAFLSGSWEKTCPQAVVKLWTKRWNPPKGDMEEGTYHYKSPSHLYPGKSPNDVYIGVEMLPLTRRTNGLLFTEAQHEAVAELACDIAKRWRWASDWWNTGRLATHEDLNPLTRSNSGGGWDPGTLRRIPSFSMLTVRTYCFNLTHS